MLIVAQKTRRMDEMVKNRLKFRISSSGRSIEILSEFFIKQLNSTQLRYQQADKCPLDSRRMNGACPDSYKT
jgi:hypothetical protein